MAKRVQSPSSMNTYKKCPRKYYYAYIRELEALPSIHQVRGKIAHSVLEKFFDADVSSITLKDYEQKLSVIIQNLLLKEWCAAKKDLDQLGLSSEQLQFYFEETLLMLLNWLDHFSASVKLHKGTFQEIFKHMTPEREKLYKSEVLQVQGIIDAIETINNELRIMDYKTSNNFDEEEHRLQLAVYSLLYQEQHGRLPDKAGIYFLKDKPKFIKVDQQLLDFARKEIELIHQKTCSEDIKDYPKNKSRFCRYSTGQCEYFDVCQKED
ncbi:MAG: PD-(D/E)XK nuclease family protein [Candidatus Woesearchaeota archaeon]